MDMSHCSHMKMLTCAPHVLCCSLVLCHSMKTAQSFDRQSLVSSPSCSTEDPLFRQQSSCSTHGTKGCTVPTRTKLDVFVLVIKCVCACMCVCLLNRVMPGALCDHRTIYLCFSSSSSSSLPLLSQGCWLYPL